MTIQTLTKYFVLAVAVAATASCTRTMPPDAGIQPYKSAGRIAVDSYIPQNPTIEPNDATLQFYFTKYRMDRLADWAIEGSEEPAQFNKKPSQNNFLNRQMEETAIVSYLYLKDNTVVYDEVSPEYRFGGGMNDSSLLMSHSVGKSWTSYVLGHAICAGYIDGIDARINDYPPIEGTLYNNQKLINFLNMRTGDKRYVTFETGVKPNGRWYNNHSIADFAENELKGSTPGAKEMNYHALNPNIILNYIIYKAGDEAESFFKEVFQDHIGIAEKLRFNRLHEPLERGTVRVDGHASRYDFLRIASSMLRDWNEDNCVGRYLKEVMERSQPNSSQPTSHVAWETGGYGGFFYTDYSGMRGRNIFGMDGYGGQSVLINFDENRIVSVNAIHTNYNWRELVYKVIKYGDIQKE